MRVIGKSVMEAQLDLDQHRDEELAVVAWCGAVERAAWKSLSEIEEECGESVSVVMDKVVFDLPGADAKLICLPDFARQAMLVLWAGASSEYAGLADRGGKKLRQL